MGISGAQHRQYSLTLVPPEDEQRVALHERTRKCDFLEAPVGGTERPLLGLVRLLVDDRGAVSVRVLESQQGVTSEVAVTARLI